MLGIVRNLAGGFTSGLAATAVTRLGAQSVAALSSRSWIVQDRTPFVTSMKPLGERMVVIPQPRCEAVADGPPAKAPLEIRFKLKDGRDGLVRRAQAGDLEGLLAFMRKPEVAVGPPAYDAGHADEAAQEHLWMATAPDYDAMVAVVDGRIVGVASIDPQTHELAAHKDAYFLKSHGVTPGEVCVGHLSVSCEAQDQGVGTALKKAEAIAATQAGFRGVTHDASNPTIKAIVKKLGGNVDDRSMLGWTLLRGDAKGVKPA